jgi:hypothetical protein
MADRESAINILSASLGVRPARAGVFVPPVEGIAWEQMFTAALGALGRFWGGSQNLVFPLQDDLHEHELFWALADRFDADDFLLFNGAFADLEDAAPDAYAAARDREEKLVAEFDPGIIQRHLADWRKLWFVEPEVPDGLVELLIRGVAPLHRDAHPELQPFGGMDQPPYPFTDVADLADIPQPLIDVRTTAGAVERLLLACEVGRISPGLRAALTTRGIEIEDQLLDTPLSWRQFGFLGLERRSGVYPLELTEFGLEWYRRQPLSQLPLPIVVGDDPWDFTLFYALRRWQSLAYWVPTTYLDNDAYCRNVFIALQRLPTVATDVAVISASGDDNLLAQASERLTAHYSMVAPSGRRLSIKVGDWRTFVREVPNRLFERDNYGRPQPLIVVDGVSPQLPTPLPRNAATRVPTDIRWMTEVAIDGWSAMRHRHLGRRVLDAGVYDESLVRAGTDGIAYHCPHFFTRGGVGLEAATVRPRLQPLEFLDQLTVAADPTGWRIFPSDKGIYTRESAALFGGVADLAGALRSPQVRAILDTYKCADSSAPGKVLPDGRTYLSLADLGKLVGEDDAANHLGELEPLRVLRRGVILKCRRCRAAAFYSAAEFEPAFRCVRCRLDQSPNRESWLNTIEPIWRYGLDEVIFQFLDNNGHLPLLAAYDRFHDALEPVTYTFELDAFDAAGQKSEIDIAVLEGARLWIGEATIRDRFRDSGGEEHLRLQRFAEVADLLNAHGVIFATSAAAFADRTRRRLDAVFCGVRPQIEYYEAVVVEAT